MTRLLDIRVQRKDFGDSPILRDIHVTLDEREAVVLLGPSGCGKSTLLRIAAGLDTAFTGSVGTGATDPQDGQVAFVFQEPRLMPWLTVAENIGFAEGSRYDRSRTAALIEDVGLTGYADALPKALSGGMAQRVAIARALYTRPRILLMDEPFSAVDALTRMRLQDLVLQLIEHHRLSILLVTHDIDESLYLGDRIYVMGARPGTIQREIPMRVPRPRDRRDLALATLKGEILTALEAAHAL